MPNDPVRPWPREHVASFTELDTALKPEKPTHQTLAGLMGLGLAMAESDNAKNDEARRISQAWQLRKIHPVYLWLDSREEFHELCRLFEDRRKRLGSNAKIAAPNAPFILLEIVVEWVDLLFNVLDFEKCTAAQKKRPTGPTKLRRAAAVKHAEALIRLSDEGVNLSGIEGAQLRRLLVQFREQISGIERKPRGGKGSSIRLVLELVAFQLFSKLGLSSPSILENLAALADVDCDNRSAQRYSRHAKRKYRELLAEGLQKTGGQLTPNT
jgi:hypothetical protein